MQPLNRYQIVDATLGELVTFVKNKDQAFYLARNESFRRLSSVIEVFDTMAKRRTANLWRINGSQVEAIGYRPSF